MEYLIEAINYLTNYHPLFVYTIIKISEDSIFFLDEDSRKYMYYDIKYQDVVDSGIVPF